MPMDLHLLVALLTLVAYWMLILRAARALSKLPSAPNLGECFWLLAQYWRRPPKGTPPEFRGSLFDARVYLTFRTVLLGLAAFAFQFFLIKTK